MHRLMTGSVRPCGDSSSRSGEGSSVASAALASLPVLQKENKFCLDLTERAEGAACRAVWEGRSRGALENAGGPCMSRTQGSQSIHDQIDPQKLQDIERRLCAFNSTVVRCDSGEQRRSFKAIQQQNYNVQM